MAWPNTPLTTYVAHFTPVIKATDLNAFQTGINGIINGTYSLAATVIDGAGGAVVVPRAGTSKVSINDSGTGGGAGNPNLPLTSVAFGEFGKALVCLGWAVVSQTGVLLRGVNVHAVSLTVGMGAFVVDFNTVTSDPSNACALANITNASDSTIAKISTSADGAGRVRVNIITAAVNAPSTGSVAAYSVADRAFQVLLFGA